MANNTNSIKLFGENLIDFDTATDNPTTGVGFDDETWDSANGSTTEGDYSSVRNTGFIPNTPVSSVALNTALKQASVGAKIVGDILANEFITNENVGTDTDNTFSQRIQRYSNDLQAYLEKIYKLINTGEVVAHTAKNYTNGDGIANKFTELQNSINDFYTKFTNGTNVVGVAKNYVGGTTTIDAAITSLNRRVDNIGPFLLDINTSYHVGGYIKREANIIYGELTFLGTFINSRYTYSAWLGYIEETGRPSRELTFYGKAVYESKQGSTNYYEYDGAVTVFIEANGRIGVRTDLLWSPSEYRAVKNLTFAFGYEVAPRTE